MAIAEAVTPRFAAGELRMVDVDQLRAHPHNIRHDLGDLSDLVASIRERGVRVSLQITTAGVVVCGHRRLAAAREAGCTRVPCVPGEYTDAQQFEDMLIENLQRNGLTPIEEAQGYQQLLDLGEDVDAIASSVQTRPARIRERTALLQLPNGARAALEQGWITLGAAEQLLKLREHPLYPDIVEEIVNDNIALKDEDAEDKNKHIDPVSHFWEVDRALRELQEQRAIAGAREQAEAKGLTVVDLPDSYARKKSDPQRIGTGYGDLAVNAKAHQAKDCHAVAITKSGQMVPVCTKPSRHAKEIAKAKAESAPTSQRKQDEPDDVQRADEALILQFPDHQFHRWLPWIDELLDTLKRHFVEHPEEPQMLALPESVTVRWLEAEAPEKATRAPKQLPSKLGTWTKSPTRISKGLGPGRVRKEPA